MFQENQEKSGGVRLSGDARFDSPGFSAKYCTYYMQASLCKTELQSTCIANLQDLDSRKVLGVYVAMKHQVNPSLYGNLCIIK